MRSLIAILAVLSCTLVCSVAFAWPMCVDGDCLDGAGVMRDEDAGMTYAGQFRGGLFHGNGLLMVDDGTRYDGQFKNGQRDGDGVLTYPDGTGYMGQYKNGKKHGQGTEFYPPSLRYVGLFRDGERVPGQGKSVWKQPTVLKIKSAEARP